MSNRERRRTKGTVLLFRSARAKRGTVPLFSGAREKGDSPPFVSLSSRQLEHRRRMLAHLEALAQGRC